MKVRGSIAVVSLWVMTILAFLAVGLSQSLNQKISVFNQLRSKEEARSIGESAVKKIIARIQESAWTLGDLTTGDEWVAGQIGVTQTVSFENGAAEIVIEDENSKININKASAYSLANLFRITAGLDSEKAARLAAAVVDFRDPDDYVTGDGTRQGSEKGVFHQLRLAYHPKNGDFEFCQELLLVAGMTKEVYDFVKDYITIYGDGRVNVNTCSREVLLALDLAEGAADKVLGVRDGKGPAGFVFKDPSGIVDSILEFEDLSGEERESIGHAIRQNYFCVTSGYFKIAGRARTFSSGRPREFVCIYGRRDGIKYWLGF